MIHWKLHLYEAAVTILALASTCCSGLNDQNASDIYRSKHPDQILFNAATSAIERNRFDVGRMTLQTLVNTYPDSEYTEKARTALQDPRMNQCNMAWMTPMPDSSVPCTNIDPPLGWQD